MEIRTLRRDEREQWLTMLDDWDVGDGWQASALFRRYVYDDPTFRDDQVYVAAENGELLSGVQVFPRPLRIAGNVVSMGGIGTVFTRADARAKGLAGALLDRAAEEMPARGHCVSMLFSDRLPWYTKHGWRSWPLRRVLLVRPSGPPPPAVGDVSPFDPGRDLAAVRDLHDAYTGLLPGSVARDDALWDASLRNGGNPGEEFAVVRSGERLVAYYRAVVLKQILILSEFGHEPGFDEPLAVAIRRALEPREPDPLATGEKPSGELRRVASTVSLHFAPDLAAALQRTGIELKEHDDPTCMLRCVDVEALARGVGVRARADEAPTDFLARLLPADDLTFWQADRF